MKKIKNNRQQAGQRFQLFENQTLAIEDRRVQIDCLQGMIWVTWPDGNDRVLLKGQSITIQAAGLICVQAFSDSALIINRIKAKKAVSHIISNCLHFLS